MEVYMHSDLEGGKRWVVTLVAPLGIDRKCLFQGKLLIFRIELGLDIIIGLSSVKICPDSFAGSTGNPWSPILTH